MYVGISRAKVQVMVSLSLRLLGVVGIKAPPKVPVKMATQTSNKDAWVAVDIEEGLMLITVTI